MEKKTEDCKLGWHDGSCCCNCTSLVLINKHPCNSLKEAKGSILETFGYGCKAVFDSEKDNEIEVISFSSKLHGMCELHCRNIKK